MTPLEKVRKFKMREVAIEEYNLLPFSIPFSNN
jgi:hypothetical protein